MSNGEVISRMNTMRQKRRNVQQHNLKRNLLILMVTIIVVGGYAFWQYCFSPINIDGLYYPTYIQQQFISEDGYSRTGNKLKRPKDIVIHYVSNPGSSAKANRNYFDSPASKVSAHFVVGLEGEVIQCIPLDEQSSASNNRNPDTISIEVCHPGESGKFNDKTYGALVKLTAWLCTEFKLDEEDVIRHYDITGKMCPKYYVNHPDAWDELKIEIGNEM